ncbi:MAG: adenylate/guanylate cyclase domain-containing protein [Deltaproteobacteria bacterium]|nr:adenylate/guanylate cyclase domain-containing protein [Deltaproteobacteria bacterium]
MLSRVIKAVSLGLIVGLAGLALSYFPYFHELEEDVGLGLLFKFRGVRQPPADAVVVSIDKESAEQLNIPENPDKWPRSLHARLVEALARAGAKVITFDVHFIESRSASDDNLFAAANKRAENVVLGEALSAREVPTASDGAAIAPEHRIVKIVKPLPLLAESAVATAPFVLPRIPFKVNQYWTFQSGAGDSPTFPAVAFQLYTIEVYPDFIRLLERVAPGQTKNFPLDAVGAIKGRSLQRLMRDIRDLFESDPSIESKMLEELDRGYSSTDDGNKHALLKSLIKLYGGSNRRYVNYYGPPHTVTTIPFYRGLQLGQSNESGKLVDVKGKAVFVGLSERILAERKDSFYTVFSQANGVFIGGVEIAATAFLNMLEDRPVNPIGSQHYLLLIVFWGVVIGAICRTSSILLGAASVVLLSVGYFAAAAFQFKTAGTWLPIVIPLFVQAPLGFVAAVLWNYVETNKERQQIRKALAYYVPDEVVDQLAKNIVDIKNSGQMVYGACLFADVAGYTTLSEKMTPQQLSDLMHKYFEATFAPVKQHGGLVVNLKGDSFLAIWKATRMEDGLRRQACLAALDVAKAVQRFNATVEDLNLPTRVGVHSGQIFLGNIGAGDHYEYGPTGDTVNTASRMDGLNKYLGTEVLASDEIVQQLDGLLTREVGKFMLRGKAQPIVVHELLGRAEEADETRKKSLEIFTQGLAAFRRRSWDEAAEHFACAIENSPNDGPAQFYAKLCEEYRINPPGEAWDGVIALEEK